MPAAHLEHVIKVVRENIDRESRLHTDQSKLYRNIGKEFAAREIVNHTENEYAFHISGGALLTLAQASPLRHFLADRPRLPVLLGNILERGRAT